MPAMDELWQAAKQREWAKRPLKVDVRKVAAVMAADDAVQAVFMARFGFSSNAALAITTQAVLVGGPQHSRAIRKALSSAPGSARWSDEVLVLRRSQIVSVQLTPDDVQFVLADGLVVLPAPAKYREPGLEQALLALGQPHPAPAAAPPVSGAPPHPLPPRLAAHHAPPRMPPPLKLGSGTAPELPPLELPGDR